MNLSPQGGPPAPSAPATVGEPPLEGLPFTARALLAPMEGVTDAVFRDLVLARQGPRDLGGTTTEFLRVVDVPRSKRCIAESVGASRWPQPVALQLMGSEREALAETARRAADLGVALVDLNFGCPAKGALRGCAGSALLDQPAQLEDLVRTVARAVEPLPVSAKLRAGVSDDRRVEELVRAAEAGGARLITLHCRTRAEGYCEAVDWTRIARAAAALSVPLCGNGGVSSHADLARMRAETGCALVMVGRAALADPWIFSGRAVSPAEAARFLLDYFDAMVSLRGASPQGALQRQKQLYHFFKAGGLLGELRGRWLAAEDPVAVHGLLERLASGDPEAPLAP